ncbi:hypothetical protein NAT51_19500 [Flavobacterium amniphilum]|uniref:hypothetical protein n=1 Tax=Flavobacterium amniphilum TaxID=1834035 RepID=UPI00202A18E6|nr:hypothetical protein [Flavobacterium amniphilum]MCL9807712.1 hypothetical protein [Flavobacterium amniphilum]
MHQLKKCKICGLLFLTLIFSRCEKHFYTAEEINELEPTHTIVNDSMIKFFKDFETEKTFDKNSDSYIVYVKKESASNYIVSISKSKFNTFRRERKNMIHFQKLSGYLKYNNSSVLLFGDIDDFIFKRNNNKIEDVLCADSKEESGMIIYEPKFIDYSLKK